MNRARIPAIVLCDDVGFNLEICRLSVLDRLLVTLHRAGCGPLVIVYAKELPALKRAQALEIEWRRVEKLEVPETDAVGVAGNMVIQVGDVKEVIRQRGQLADGDGNGLALRFVDAGAPVDFSVRAGGPSIRPAGVARQVRNAGDARVATAELWNSLKSASDGTVDKYFNRPVGRPFSRLLLYTPVTPNQISAASIIVGLMGAWCLAHGGHSEGIMGAALFQVSAVVDCMDGDVARMALKESPLGKWLDIIGDQVVHAGIFVGIGVGLARGGTSAPVAWLAASAVVGGLISFGVVLRGWPGNSTGANRRLQAFIDGATNRDFSVLVLVLAIFQKLEWFLWLAAIGSHLYWMTALVLQMTSVRIKADEAGNV